MPAYRPSELHSLRVRPKRHFSQNFLVDQNIIQKAIRTADVQKGDTVLEIGPGAGALTETLLKKGAKVIAIEKDRELAVKLSRLEGDLSVICDDALNFPLDSIPPNTKIVASLPYHITTPIIERYVTLTEKITSMTLFVQYEAAQRICAKVNTPMYSGFTLFLQAHATARLCFPVAPNSFFPAPSVKSAVLKLSLRPFPYKFSKEKFLLLTRTAFQQRRKMIRGTLRELYSSETIENALKAIDHSPLARPGELALSDFAALFEQLENN